MRSFFEWYADTCNQNQPWLVLGKGPSFDKYQSYDVSNFRIMSLNHVVSKLCVDVAHIIDLDVVEACASDIDKNASYLVMPWIPHVANHPGEHDLGTLVERSKFLTKLSDEKRLLFYNHLADRRKGLDPLVKVTYFSAEAAIGLLTLCGTKQVKTLGIDGGVSYNQAFDYLINVTLLANGRMSFNEQFGELAKIIMNTGVDLSPLDMQSPIKVYIATTEAQMLAVKVLEYSIKKYASMSVEVIPLHKNDIETPIPNEEKNWPRTPFSFQRFLIPELQKYQGRAIYLDSDMQVFKDIKQLWSSDFDGFQLLTVKNADESIRKPQFSVMLLDCAKLDWNIKKLVSKLNDGELSYSSLMHEMVIAKHTDSKIESNWNSLESFCEGQTALLHYTDMHTQPWVSIRNPLGYLWCRDLLEAIAAGFISKEFVMEHVEKGYVRPSLAYQVLHSIEDPFLLPAHQKALDRNYQAPYQGLHHVKASAEGFSAKVHYVLNNFRAHARALAVVKYCRRKLTTLIRVIIK